MVLETIKFIVSKHPTVFENQSIFQNHGISSILCIQTWPKTQKNTLHPNRALGFTITYQPSGISCVLATLYAIARK